MRRYRWSPSTTGLMLAMVALWLLSSQWDKLLALGQALFWYTVFSATLASAMWLSDKFDTRSTTK